MERAILIIVSAIMSLTGCSPSVTSSTSAGKYSEDLSGWRPEVTTTLDTVQADSPVGPERIRTPDFVMASHAVNEEVDVVLDSIYTRNHENGYVDGYTIQVYSGIKREEALNVKRDMALKLPELESEVQYRQPNFRVRAGQYYTRLDAQRDYLLVKRHFPNAIVIPDRIPLP